MVRLTKYTESGDLYSALREDWERYREAVNRGDWEKVQWFEEGNASFKYERN